MKLPIFQFTYGFNEGQFGFIFPSELDHDVQSFLYVIALPIGFSGAKPNYFQINDALFNNEFYFPVDLNGSYLEIYGEVKSLFDFDEHSENIISFTTTDGSKIDFEMDLYHFKSLYRKKGIRSRALYKYVGKHQKAIYQNFLFIPLLLKNFDALINYYNKYNGIFVGYTNNYGVFEEFGSRG